MKAGIVSFGIYVPFYRLARDLIAKAWGGRSAGGERSVANYDEDSITMAVQAATNCLGGINRDEVDGLFFASTTSPYKEKQCSSIVAGAMGLRRDIITVDCANSLRSGTNALRLAIDCVNSGSARNILVVAADCRLGFPQSAQEQGFGDASAALLVGNSATVADVEAIVSTSDDIIDVWRLDTDIFVRSWEDRWVLTYGYAKNMEAAISRVMKENQLTAGNLAKVVFCAPDVRSHRDLARSLGFSDSQLQDPLLDNIGNTGAAHPLLMLALALNDIKATEKVLLASYGDGSDAFLLQATEGIEKVKGQQNVRECVTVKRALPTYEKYLLYRQLVTQPEEFVRLFPSATVMWRTRDWALAGCGSKCKRCGLVTFPIQRVCYGCQAKDEYEEVRLSDKKGKVFTFSLDYLAGTPQPPVVQTVVESEGGARIYCLMTDCEPGEVKVDMPVEMVLRKFHQAGGFHNYFWKCRPVRGGNYGKH